MGDSNSTEDEYELFHVYNNDRKKSKLWPYIGVWLLIGIYGNNTTVDKMVNKSIKMDLIALLSMLHLYLLYLNS